MNKSANALFLIGPNSVGKSTVGNHLANCRSVPFLNSDALVKETLASMPNITEYLKGRKTLAYGEPTKDELHVYYRFALECCDAATSDLPSYVLELGGGTVIADLPEARRFLERTRASGTVICLLPYEDDERSIRLLAERERRRYPHEDGLSVENRARRLYVARKERYTRCADHVIHTGDRSIDAIVNDVETALATIHTTR